ncbi:DUF6286 domain-containing protein [Corynebacterium heidelbergense]|uniref:DUF6286 domain-containing protein n=1 Tax=Corynebacterium heidelbergense TaxID=2055947 RepID=A0A364VCQ6_9CORY|nr:DUF6286 domain-containing protein [Corynebacterium heidelbergense]RAV34439.1 hypothetical protein CWC39_03245 [Corynebacterium heidelbergense]WCZ37542.1 hypothetical protein CHEID_10100 [Corynebacterium heidelbergense]
MSPVTSPNNTVSTEVYRPQPSGRFAAPLPTAQAPAGTADGTANTSAAPEPKAAPAAKWLVLLLGLLLLALTAVLIRDILVHEQVITGGQWLPDAFTWLGALTFVTWMFAAAIACGLVALLVLWFVFKPRAKTHLPLAAGTEAWVRPTDVARMSTASARRINGVLRAHSKASRKKVKVHAVVGVLDDGLQQRITDAVERRLSVLADPPAVQVRVTNEGANR